MNQEEKTSLDFWNEKYREGIINTREDIVTDDWLNKFEHYTASCSTVLDLGCGSGNDTQVFLEKGKKVTVCDQSEICIENIKRIFPELLAAECFHMPGVFPFQENAFDVICADLCLHYFIEKDTFDILNELKRILVPDGYLLVRVNSVNDTNHGAGAGEETESHLFRTEDGMLKRFFDEKDVKHFFSEFDILFCEEQDMNRYKALKKVYTVCLRNRK